MTFKIRPYHDSDEEFINSSDGYSNRHEEHPQDVNEEEPKSTAATQADHFKHISESASMNHKIEDYGQTPLRPPTYSDATAGEADAKDDINGLREPLTFDIAPLDPEDPNARWQSSKCFLTNRRKVAKFVLKFMTILVGLGFIVHAIKVCISLLL